MITLDVGWWWTVDTDKDGNEIAKRTKVHVIAINPDTRGSITLCGLEPYDEHFNDKPSAYRPACKRCMGTHVGKWVMGIYPW